MSHLRYVVWRGEAAIAVNPDTEGPHEEELCIDTHYTPRDPGERYGKYTGRGWEHVPLEEFPPEFRMHLLLMGVA